MEALGGGAVFWNIYNVNSYATMRCKCDMFVRYRSKDSRIMPWSIADAASIAALIAPGGKKHYLVDEGGHWWRHVQMNIARRDGDVERLAEFEAVEGGVMRALSMSRPILS